MTRRVRIPSAPLLLLLAATAWPPAAPAAPGITPGGDVAALLSADLGPPGRMEFVPLLPLLFEHDADLIDERGMLLLEDVALFVRYNPRVARVLVKGHADMIAGDPYNEALSRRRAEAVRAQLLSLGVPARLLHVTAYGRSAPVDEDWTPEGRARNRRVELYVVLY